MKWLIPVNAHQSLPYKYFQLRPQEPIGGGKSISCTEFASVPNGENCLVYWIWEMVYKNSQMTSPDVVVWAEDISKLQIIGSGLYLNSKDTDRLSQIQREVNMTPDSRVSTLSGYAELEHNVELSREFASEVLTYLADMQKRGINHLAFRGLKNPSAISQLHLAAIARLFNARTVSIPDLPCMFRSYKVQKGDKMDRLHLLLNNQGFYGSPPAEIALHNSALLFDSKARTEADVRAFYQQQFRFASPPLTNVGSEVVLYGLVRNAASNDFIFPGNPEYARHIKCFNNGKYDPPAIAAKTRNRLCERIRERRAARIANRKVRRAV